MIPALPLFHRIAGQKVIVLGEGDAADAKRRLVERAGGIPLGEDAEARLAFVALDSDPAPTVARLRARGLLVNCVDRPDLCDFTVPSLIDRAPVVIAIGTAGASAGLAKALRLRLETLLPARLGALATALSAARATLRARWPEAADRRRRLDAALCAGAPLDPLREDAANHLATWLASAEREPGQTVEIHLTSDDPDDLTLRQSRLLGTADHVAYEPAVPEAILNRARADAIRHPITPGAAIAAPGTLIILRVKPASTS